MRPRIHLAGATTRRSRHKLRDIASLIALSLGALLMSACDNQLPSGGSEATDDTRIVSDDAVGASVSAPSSWTLEPDPFVGENYGFVLTEPDPGDAEFHLHRPVLRVALVHEARPADVDALVRKEIETYPAMELEATDVVINGVRGVAVEGMPAVEGQYTAVYVAVDGRVYKIGVWRGLDEEAQRLFDRITFRAPTRTVASLSVPDKAAYLRSVSGGLEPGDEVVLDYSRTGGEPLPEGALSLADDAAGLAAAGLATATAADGYCATMPSGVLWQTQWYKDTDYFGGSPGWTRYGYPYYWGQNYHIGCTDDYQQHYAADFAMTHGSQVYPATGGTVEYVGQTLDDGYWSLGLWIGMGFWYNGYYYYTRSAHLSSENVYKGQGINYTDIPYVVIGWSGCTGACSIPHLHSAAMRDVYLDAYGRDYWGRSVKPSYIRCYACTNYDIASSSGGGWYTKFWEDRWMKY